ncbi:unnamed protein product [Linum trigynum]|uniref:Uncharacterized protein n=1 Tax=Linum trigynum TaxID=586398 RepID=A0AAV2E8A4_9ROSI
MGKEETQRNWKEKWSIMAEPCGGFLLGDVEIQEELATAGSWKFRRKSPKRHGDGKNIVGDAAEWPGYVSSIGRANSISFLCGECAEMMVVGKDQVQGIHGGEDGNVVVMGMRRKILVTTDLEGKTVLILDSLLHWVRWEIEKNEKWKQQRNEAREVVYEEKWFTGGKLGSHNNEIEGKHVYGGFAWGIVSTVIRVSGKILVLFEVSPNNAQLLFGLQAGEGNSRGFNPTLVVKAQEWELEVGTGSKMISVFGEGKMMDPMLQDVCGATKGHSHLMKFEMRDMDL